MTEKTDHTILVLAAAAVAVGLYLGWKSPDAEGKLNNCLSELKGFKDGVLYGR